MKQNDNEMPKCYNSFSCIGAILIILFVLGSIIWDICFTKPAIKSSIEEIRIEIKDIHNELEQKLNSDTINFMDVYKQNILKQDTVSIQKDTIH